MNLYTEKSTIKSWAEEDRPREKLILKGKNALSDAELLAILINSGSNELSAVELSRQILNQCNYNLNLLSKLNIAELCKFKGIGEAKAITIIAAMELARRRKNEEAPKKLKVSCAKDAYEIFSPFLQDLSHEEFWIILLNRKLEVIKTLQVSIGGVTGTVVDARIIFKHAIENLASCIILAHNHPSGNLKPSNEDLKITNSLCSAGKLLDITISDHIIYTNSAFLSMADEGLLYS